jgi:2-iminoacetate synthase
MSSAVRPDWLAPEPWCELARRATAANVRAALCADVRHEPELAALLSPAAAVHLEVMAQAAQALTRRHFGRTISLYAPLYLSNYCSNGCTYCGFASDRKLLRRRLELPQVEQELRKLADTGLEEVLLLTGERSPKADLDYLLACVGLASMHFHAVTVEAFPMAGTEYAQLAAAGCTGVTLYQETYDPETYEKAHRWGPKRDYAARLAAPAAALDAGIRSVGLGALLGLGDPLCDVIALYQHTRSLQRRFWRSGFSLSFPRLRPEPGGFEAPRPVGDVQLAQIVFAIRLLLPDAPLTLSTREAPRFRDGMAGVGVSKMSVASRTTVGGYARQAEGETGQFAVSDGRDVESFASTLRGKSLEPVFKNWDATYRG